MLQLKLLSAFAALGFIVLVAGAGSPKAAEIEIDFGALVPNPGGCSHTNSADSGFVCANSQTFNANGGAFTATGYSNAFTTPTALTLKPSTTPPGPPDNILAESGLGENAAGPPSACTDASIATDCEIAGTASVAVVSNHAIDDAIIGSVQAGENFQFFTGSSIATLTPFEGVMVGGSCIPGPVADTCIISGFSALVVGVESGGTGNVLLTAVSQDTTSMPEPATLALLGTAFIGFGLFCSRRSRG
jgi:hypothetical protein